jgi:hypothetical protein
LLNMPALAGHTTRHTAFPYRAFLLTSPEDL